MADPTVTPAPVLTQAQISYEEFNLLKAKIGVLEAAASNDWSKVKAWVGTNWPHFITWATGVAVAAKVGLVADLVKLL